jgi:hypothetical protein
VLREPLRHEQQPSSVPVARRYPTTVGEVPGQVIQRLLPADPSGPTGARLRSVVFATASVGLAASAHLMGGGRLPPWWLLVGSVWAVHLAAQPFATVERGLAVLGGAMVLVQAALHAAFTIAMTSTPAPGTASMRGMAPMAGPLRLRAVLPAGGRMLVLHLCAALLVAAWLRLGERQLFRLAATMTRRARAALTDVVAFVLSALRGNWPDPGASGLRVLGVRSAPPSPPRGLVIATVHAHRGPPRLAA